MKLLIQELNASALTQDFTPTRNTIVEAIRPHIYRHNTPAGTVKLQIYNGATLVAESATKTITTIGTLAYYHGYEPFYINAYLAKNVTYTMKLVGAGYTFSESNYCAWVNGHDLAKYPITSTPVSHYNYPLDYEIWERTAK